MDSDIGAQCSYPLCREVDFLPIKCNCGNHFCRTHAFPDRHGCTYNSRADGPGVQPTTSKRELCALDGCNRPSLDSVVVKKSDTEDRTPAICPGCKLAFCAS